MLLPTPIQAIPKPRPPLAPIPFDPVQITSPENRSNPKPGSAAPTLAAQEKAPCIAFEPRDLDDIAPTLNTVKPACVTPPEAYGFQTRIARNGRGDMGDTVHALTSEAGEDGRGDSAPCVAVTLHGSHERVRPQPFDLRFDDVSSDDCRRWDTMIYDGRKWRLAVRSSLHTEGPQWDKEMEPVRRSVEAFGYFLKASRVRELAARMGYKITDPICAGRIKMWMRRRAECLSPPPPAALLPSEVALTKSCTLSELFACAAAFDDNATPV